MRQAVLDLTCRGILIFSIMTALRHHARIPRMTSIANQKEEKEEALPEKQSCRKTCSGEVVEVGFAFFVGRRSTT